MWVPCEKKEKNEINDIFRSIKNVLKPQYEHLEMHLGEKRKIVP